jgi:DNA-binding transcriptional regulator LsrR (DeoR family)
VVRTTIATDVARETARLLLRLVRECHLEDKKRNEVHIGFAAGLSMREVAQVFAKLLTYPEPDLPENIAFHALVAGHDPRDPTTDPNAFFTFFLTPPSITIKPSFMGLHAPAMVPWQEIKKLRSTPEIREAYDAAKQLDIVVTSGSDWNDEHSALRFCMERSQSSMTTLRNLGVIGDMLWRPISERGPILQRTAVRALTVLELSDLPTLIRKKKRVLLMLGPCAVCHHPKGRLLKGILSHEEQLASHLVVDSGTALELLREIGAF